MSRHVELEPAAALEDSACHHFAPELRGEVSRKFSWMLLPRLRENSKVLIIILILFHFISFLTHGVYGVADIFLFLFIFDSWSLWGS